MPAIQLSIVCACGREVHAKGLCRGCYKQQFGKHWSKGRAKPTPKTLRTCVVCGKQFETKNDPRIRCCSRSCSDVNKCGVQCDTCGRPMYSGKKPVKSPIRRCHPCRRRLPGKNGPHSDAVKARDDTCEYCRAKFRSVERATGKWSRFCSRACANGGRTKTGEFAGKGHVERARRGGGCVEVVNRLAVFERDGWFCGICGLGIDPDLRWPHSGSASLDHIVPLSIGGDHTYTNVQASHLFCNLSKGGKNRPGFAKEVSGGSSVTADAA